MANEWSARGIFYRRSPLEKEVDGISLEEYRLLVAAFAPFVNMSKVTQVYAEDLVALAGEDALKNALQELRGTGRVTPRVTGWTRRSAHYTTCIDGGFPPYKSDMEMVGMVKHYSDPEDIWFSWRETEVSATEVRPFGVRLRLQLHEVIARSGDDWKEECFAFLKTFVPFDDLGHVDLNRQMKTLLREMNAQQETGKFLQRAAAFASLAETAARWQTTTLSPEQRAAIIH